ncbi:pumilio RNA-binding protein [Trypanosoma vivax]|nr:pumilio RNA-binding protein [Trypanosoma vivax]
MSNPYRSIDGVTFSLVPTEHSWGDEVGAPHHAHHLLQQHATMKVGSEGIVGPSGAVVPMPLHGRGDVSATGGVQRAVPFATPPPSQQHVAGWTRYTPMDFELFLQEGRPITDDMRRSPVYLKWYNGKRQADSRIPPPLVDPRNMPKEGVEVPWDPMVSNRLSGPQQATGGGGAESGGRANISLELDVKNLQQAHDQQTFNPYAMCFQQDENMLSPGTQFFGAYAPTPLATMATPNTLRAYAHARMAPQSRGGGATGREFAQVVTPVANQAVYSPDWNAAGDFGGAPGVVPNICQQYYTQEHMGAFDYYTDPAVASYYNATATGVSDHTQMQPAIMAIAAGGDTGSVGDGAGRARRGGGRGRGGNVSGKWGSGSGRGGRNIAYRESMQPRSELLEQFHFDSQNGSTSHWRINHIIQNAAEFAQDQEGSRFIQRAVADASPEEVDALFREIFESPLDLVVDIFGNYVLQKLLEIGTPQQLAYAATRLKDKVVSLTLQTYGCRVIQKCIEVMPPEGLDIILSELEGNVAKCIQDQNGNHVVQKCVEVIPARCGFIVSAFSDRVMELATHAYGCRVIQCIMEHCPDQEEVIFSELLQCVGTLAKDQYGNYVIQHVLKHMTDDSKVSRIFDALKDSFYEFSTQKFASNVMEKVFDRANPQQRMELIGMMCSPVKGLNEAPVDVLCFQRSAPMKKEAVEKGRNDFAKKGRRDREREREKESSLGVVFDVQLAGKEQPSMLCLMMQNQFANYVAQRVLDAAEPEQFGCLIDNIQKFLIPISGYTFGAPVVQRLVRRELIKAPDDMALNMAPGAASRAGKGGYSRNRREGRGQHNCM